LVDSALQVVVFVLVALLETLQVIQFIHEVAHLLLERADLAVTLRQLLLLALQVESLLVDETVQLFDLVEGFRNFELEVSNVGAQIVTLVGLRLVSHVQTVDLFEVFAVSLSERTQLVINLALL